MNNLYLLLLTIGALNLNGQKTFSISELEKLCAYSEESFHGYMLNNGYSRDSNYTDADSQFYSCNQPRIDGKKDECGIRNRPAPVVAFLTTTDKSYYIKAKKALDKGGYIYQKSASENVLGLTEVTWYYFANKTFTAILYYYYANDLTYYNVRVFKN
jgi:hypothetical protein